MVIPDRWMDYTNIGDVIPGTRFIAFKVPLRQTVCDRLPDDQKHTTKHVLEGIPNGNQLGMVINLTNTKSDRKYYEPDDWNIDTDSNIEYHRVKVEGRVVPERAVLIRFFEHVNEFLKKDSERLIGVHCTHGVNRTGLFLVAHMIIFQSMSPYEAIEKFTQGRGHEIERQNYVEYLKRLPSLIAKGENFLPDDNDRTYPTYERSRKSRGRSHEFKRKWDSDNIHHDDDFYATNSWRNHDEPGKFYPKKPKHSRSYYSTRNEEGHNSRYENSYREHDRYRSSSPRNSSRRNNSDNFARDLDYTDREPYKNVSSTHSRNNPSRTDRYHKNLHDYDTTPHPSTLAVPPSYNSHHKKWINPNLKKK